MSRFVLFFVSYPLFVGGLKIGNSGKILYIVEVHCLIQVKIQGSSEEMLNAACEMFLDKTDADIQQVALETLEGHQRAIMGNMTVEVF